MDGEMNDVVLGIDGGRKRETDERRSGRLKERK